MDTIDENDLPFYYFGINEGEKSTCGDPYWSGCKEEVMYYRERIWSDALDMLEFLCEDCFHCMKNDKHIDPDDWKEIV